MLSFAKDCPVTMVPGLVSLATLSSWRTRTLKVAVLLLSCVVLTDGLPFGDGEVGSISLPTLPPVTPKSTSPCGLCPSLTFCFPFLEFNDFWKYTCIANCSAVDCSVGGNIDRDCLGTPCKRMYDHKSCANHQTQSLPRCYNHSAARTFQPCGVNEMWCSRENPYCYLVEYHCNGVKNCPGGEDEENCQTATPTATPTTTRTTKHTTSAAVTAATRTPTTRPDLWTVTPTTATPTTRVTKHTTSAGVTTEHTTSAAVTTEHTTYAAVTTERTTSAAVTTEHTTSAAVTTERTTSAGVTTATRTPTTRPGATPSAKVFPTASTATRIADRTTVNTTSITLTATKMRPTRPSGATPSAKVFPTPSKATRIANRTTSISMTATKMRPTRHSGAMSSAKVFRTPTATRIANRTTSITMTTTKMRSTRHSGAATSAKFFTTPSSTATRIANRTAEYTTSIAMTTTSVTPTTHPDLCHGRCSPSQNCTFFLHGYYCLGSCENNGPCNASEDCDIKLADDCQSLPCDSYATCHPVAVKTMSFTATSSSRAVPVTSEAKHPLSLTFQNVSTAFSNFTAEENHAVATTVQTAETVLQQDKKTDIQPEIIGLTVGAGVLLVIVSLLCWRWYRRRKCQHVLLGDSSNEAGDVEMQQISPEAEADSGADAGADTNSTVDGDTKEDTALI